MTDLHSHILPGIDDGSKNVEMSLRLLDMEKENFVTALACTPHFDFERQKLDEFIHARYESAKKLAKVLMQSDFDIHLKFGAEVRISPQILDNDPAPLCYQNTKVMLLEMPVRYRPQWDSDVMYQLNLAGVTPLIAHIERYPYLQEDPNIVMDWFESGAFFQVNAASITDSPKLRKLVFELIAHDMVHVVASDTHSPDRRPPKLHQAMNMIADKFGKQIVQKMDSAAQMLFLGKEPSVNDPTPIKKSFWRAT